MLVPDNLKAAVIKTDRYEPSLNRVLEDMGNHYGTVVVPARPVHPKDKSNVEGNVRLVYMRCIPSLRGDCTCTHLQHPAPVLCQDRTD